MLTGLATAPDADAAGLAPVGAAAGPHAVATPTAASACRNRLRSILMPSSRFISFPPCVRRARLYLRCDAEHARSQSGPARAPAPPGPLEDLRAGRDRATRRSAGAGADGSVHRAVDAARSLSRGRPRNADHRASSTAHGA